MRYNDMAAEANDAHPRHANFLTVGLAVFYVAWQFLMPLITMVVPGAIVMYLGTISAALLVLLAVVTDSAHVFGANRTIFLWALGLLAIGSFSGLLSASPDGLAATRSFAYQVLTITFMYAVFNALARHEGTLRLLLWILVILAVFNAAIAIWGAATGKVFMGAELEQVGFGAFGYDASTGRAGGLRGENYAGAWIAPALAVGLILLFKRAYNPLAIAITGASMLGIAVSLSRTSALCAIVISISCIIITIKRRIRVLNTVLLILIMAAGLYLGRVILSGQSSHFSTVAGSSQAERWSAIGNMIGSRVGAWIDGISMGLNSPLWGNGPGAITYRMDTVPHNSVLDAFVDLGIIGVLIFFAPIVHLIAQILRNGRLVAFDKYLAPLTCAFMGMLTTWLTLSNMYMKLIWMMAALLSGRLAFLREAQSDLECAFGEMGIEPETDVETQPAT